MPYKNKIDRRKHYESHKEEINAKRRERNRIPEIHKKKLILESKWREENREKANKSANESKRKYEALCKELVFNHYGKFCSCCGESNIKFLTIDHINGGGRKHRENIKSKIQVWLVKNNFPNDFQILCYNCNCGRNSNHGICPHKDN
jgi:Cdc6-like AAA superfamily ATPase